MGEEVIKTSKSDRYRLLVSATASLIALNLASAATGTASTLYSFNAGRERERALHAQAEVLRR